MISLLHAEDPMAAAPAAQAASPSPFSSLMPLVVIFVIFYFLLIRPQQKKMKTQQQMLKDLKVEDKIITSSGIYGVIVGVGDTTLDVKISDNAKIKILKSAVSEKLGGTQPQAKTPA